eukprot:TRINITY_DN22434_c1_g1_i1.p1 TRINITY_DN22434_c1_g1~~TRINITY_DN22434_c1_g1_i1.p1  ORF type:complete len:180 (-),score=40.16 TRINITY_DN22434_c1_g1_i1:92-550(-)
MAPRLPSRKKGSKASEGNVEGSSAGVGIVKQKGMSAQTATVESAPSLLDKQRAAKQKPKRELTIAERRARNQRLTERFREEQLYAAFGKSRDGQGRKRSKDSFDLETDDDRWSIAPTRVKRNRLEENITNLTQRQDPSMGEIFHKSLMSIAR